MQTMTPDPFRGSMPSPDIASERVSRKLDLICSGLAILPAASVWLGASLNGPVHEIAELTKASGAVLLAAALMGIALIKSIAGWEKLGTSLILDAVGRRLGMHPTHRGVLLAREETPPRGIAGLVEAVVWRVLRLNAPPCSRAELGDRYDAAVREGRAQAQQIVRALYRDADRLSKASGEIETVAQRLDAARYESSSACNATESAFSSTEKHLISLSGAVAATTAELRRMTEAAVALSDRAFVGQRGVAALDDSSSKLLAGIEQIEDTVKRVGTLGQAAVTEASRSGEAGAKLAPIAIGIQDLARATLAATAALRDEAAGMSVEIAAAMRTAQEICAWVTGQHDLGMALSNVVNQQMEEIASIPRSLEKTRSGFVTLRATVDVVARLSSTRLATAGALRDASGRLPSHANAVAAILRDVPDFLPSSRFAL